jgi:hypothetical protein
MKAMAGYREALSPPADEDVAALAELGRRVASTKTWVLVPALLLTIGAGLSAALLHLSGYLPLLGRLPDGSYYVNKGSILIVTVLAGMAVAAPALILYRLAVRWTIDGWKRIAKERYRLDDESIADLAEMFVPKLRVPIHVDAPRAPERRRYRRRGGR